jgi:hypothetical protein
MMPLARRFVCLWRIARWKKTFSASSRSEELVKRFQIPLASSTSAKRMMMQDPILIQGRVTQWHSSSEP